MMRMPDTVPIRRKCQRRMAKNCASGERIMKKSGCKSAGRCIPVYKKRAYKRRATYKDCKSYQDRVKGRCVGRKNKMPVRRQLAF